MTDDADTSRAESSPEELAAELAGALRAPFASDALRDVEPLPAFDPITTWSVFEDPPEGAA